MEVNEPEPTKGIPSPPGRQAVPGLKLQDGTYIPAIVPPEWQAYLPTLRLKPLTFASEQTRLAKLVRQTNEQLTFSPVPPFTGLKYIAGVDISFVKNTQKACAMLTVLDFPELTIAYKTYDIVEMTEEYIPFYLAFREVNHLVRLFERMKEEAPEKFPQVVFVDGGGVWHPKGCPFTSLAKER